jgi:anti-anti-sigma factor
MRQQEEHRSAGCADFAVRVLDERSRGRPVVAVHGEVDKATAPLLAAALATAIDGASCIEVDLGETTFMDSAGLKALVAAQIRLGRLPEAVMVRNPRRSIRRLLEAVGSTALFDIRPAPAGRSTPADRGQAN